VVVYTGILPVTQNEAGLAVVMGHEIAHAVAKHSNERMSQALLAQLGGQTLATALQDKPQETQQIWMTVFGVGVQVGAMLPYSRLQEGEADHLGLIFMAMADYDPNSAVEFWQRMADNAGAKPPEFLSTHPSDENRIRKIKSEIPEAMKYYKK
jgi:predicted Zn-dependent protease